MGMNDGVPKELCSLSYISVDDMVARDVRLGRGSELAKIDVR